MKDFVNSVTVNFIISSIVKKKIADPCKHNLSPYYTHHLDISRFHILLSSRNKENLTKLAQFASLLLRSVI